MKILIVLFSLLILLTSCSKDLDEKYTIEGYLMEGYQAPNKPLKGQKVELEFIAKEKTGTCTKAIDGTYAYTGDNGYFKITYIGAECEGYINLIENGFGIEDLYNGIERNKNIKLDTLYDYFRSYSIIRYKNYQNLLANDTIIIPAQGLGGDNKNKFILGPFKSEIIDTVIIYNNNGASFWFIVNDYNRKVMSVAKCRAGKINSYNMVDVE